MRIRNPDGKDTRLRVRGWGSPNSDDRACTVVPGMVVYIYIYHIFRLHFHHVKPVHRNDRRQEEEGQEPEERRQALDEGRQALDEGRQALDEGRQALDEGRQALDEGRQNLECEGIDLVQEGGSLSHVIVVTQGFDEQEEECPADKNLTNYESKFGDLWLFHFTFYIFLPAARDAGP